MGNPYPILRLWRLSGEFSERGSDRRAALGFADWMSQAAEHAVSLPD